MPRINYVPRRFSGESHRLIGIANVIIDEYVQRGLELTIRQLYYQFVARGHLSNEERSYKKLIALMGDARLAGHVDWRAIVDRTRRLEQLPHWAAPADVVRTASQMFNLDRWADQPCRVEVWVEKEALAGVVEYACRPLDVPFFSCRGYVSLSEMWVAAERLIDYQNHGQQPVILYLGDHDPSGIDMTRDITDRLVTTFGAVDAVVDRLALNLDQIRQLRPPPNPAKMTDKRARQYVKRFGRESWELDALSPTDIVRVIQHGIETYIDSDRYQKQLKRQTRYRRELAKLATHYQTARAVVRKLKVP